MLHVVLDEVSLFLREHIDCFFLFRPEPGGLGSDVPFYGETSHKMDFVEKVPVKTRPIKVGDFQISMNSAMSV